MPPRALQVGSATVLVGGLQARNNARVILSGSTDMFSDALLMLQGSGNKEVHDFLPKQRTLRRDIEEGKNFLC